MKDKNIKIIFIFTLIISTILFSKPVFAQDGTGADIFHGGGQDFSGTIYDQSSSDSDPVASTDPNIVSGDAQSSIYNNQTQVFGSNQTQSANISTNGPRCNNLNWSSLSNIVAFAVCLVNKFLIPILATLALLLFIWGVTQYVINADNEEARESGKRVMIWGIFALSAMVLVYGLVQLLIVTLGLGSGFGIPQLK